MIYTDKVHASASAFLFREFCIHDLSWLCVMTKVIASNTHVDRLHWLMKQVPYSTLTRRAQDCISLAVVVFPQCLRLDRATSHVSFEAGLEPRWHFSSDVSLPRQPPESMPFPICSCGQRADP